MSNATCSDPRVVAIRGCPVVGRGTCSHWDECYEDTDLVRFFDAEKIVTPRAAVECARMIDNVMTSRMLDCRSGEDTDVQLVIAAEKDTLHAGDAAAAYLLTLEA